MGNPAVALTRIEEGDTSVAAEALPRVAFEEVYKTWFAFVWRTAQRLGVMDSALDDVVQDIFLVVHRKLDEFEGRSSMKTWLFAIVRRVVSEHRRSRRRKPTSGEPGEGFDAMKDPNASSSFKRLEARDLVNRFLEALYEAQREVFVLAELEQMTLNEISEATQTNPNTVASRLRAARRIFEDALERHERGTP